MEFGWRCFTLPDDWILLFTQINGINELNIHGDYVGSPMFSVSDAVGELKGRTGLSQAI